MRHFTTGWVFESGAAALVALSVAPVPGDAQAAGSAIDGVYTQKHVVRTVEGPSASVEDVVELVHYDPTHLFFRIATRFDVGHSCNVHGVATQVDQVFVYRSKQPQADNQGPCTLKFEITADGLRITDRLEPNGPSTCIESCGRRGTLAYIAISNKHRRPIKDLAALKKSTEYLAAVEELNMKEPER